MAHVLLIAFLLTFSVFCFAEENISLENHRISQISFHGNTSLRQNALLNVISSRVNTPVSSNLVDSDKDTIRETYLKSGFLDAQVRHEIVAARNNSVEVNFYITEGNIAIIGEIFFEGNSLFNNDILLDLLSIKPGDLHPPDTFDLRRSFYFPEQRDAIIGFYEGKGYLDVQVIISQNIIKDSQNNNTWSYTFHILEGQKYTFTGVTFTGEQIMHPFNSEVSAITIDDISCLYEVISQVYSRLHELYGDSGYIENEIRNEWVRNAEKGTLTFRISITEGRKFYIENIIFRGNTKISNKGLLMCIPIRPGDVCSLSEVKKSILNIMKLNIFSIDSSVETVHGSEDGLVDIIFILRERGLVYPF